MFVFETKKKKEADYYCIEPLIRLLEAEEVPDACGGRHFESLLKGLRKEKKN